MAVQLRTLQKFCQPWRKTVLTPQERAVRYEVEPGNEMSSELTQKATKVKANFGFEDIEI